MPNTQVDMGHKPTKSIFVWRIQHYQIWKDITLLDIEALIGSPLVLNVSQLCSSNNYLPRLQLLASINLICMNNNFLRVDNLGFNKVGDDRDGKRTIFFKKRPCKPLSMHIL